MSLLIADNLVVSMHYKLTDDEGELIDTSEGDSPLLYLHGAGNIVPGLEKAMSGKAAGDKLEVRLEPEEGYGEILPEMITTMGKEVFHGVENIEVGMAFEAQDADGSVQSVVVKDIDGDDITIDANHPLAGVPLNFQVEVVAIREATEEEIASGHAH